LVERVRIGMFGIKFILLSVLIMNRLLPSGFRMNELPSASAGDFSLLSRNG